MNRNHATLILLLATLLIVPATAIPANAKKPLLASFCTNLTTQNQPPLGHTYNLTFTCTGSSAFTAQQATTGIPTYTLPAGYNALYITGPIIQQLTSGTPINLPAGNYQYLAQYDGSPLSTLQSFTITWSSR